LLTVAFFMPVQSFFFMKTSFLKSLLILAFSGMALTGLAQKKQTSTLHHGKKMTWATKPVMAAVLDPKTGKSSTKEVLDRGKLLTYDGKQVIYEVPRSMERDIEKKIKSAVRSKRVERPLFNEKEVRIHFTNYVIDTEGKVAFYEVLIFPYKHSVQLYPNEYTEAVKLYLKTVDNAVKEMPSFGQQESPIFSEKILEL